jgi:hypothetical protein
VTPVRTANPYNAAEAAVTLALLENLPGDGAVPHAEHEEWFCNLYRIAADYTCTHFATCSPERSFWITTKDVWRVGEGHGHMAMAVSLYPDGTDVVVVVSWPGAKARDATCTARYALTKRERMGLAVGSRKSAIKIALYIIDTLTREGRGK